MIRVNVNAFISDNTGNPILSIKHQGILKWLFPFCSKVLLHGINCHKSIEPYKLHIFTLFKSQKTYTENDLLDHNYKDYLQLPMQPLMTNLESISYETFENDKVKYNCYQTALTQALRDYKSLGHFKGMSGKEIKSEEKSVKVLLVGAGRGPLIKRAFKASEIAGVPIEVTAIEKNPNAITTLRNLIYSETWGQYVTVVKTDIRNLYSTNIYDIIVSELLGSFGDNELSPECLYATEKYLSPSGIFIPREYTSYLHPMSSPKLWSEVKNIHNKFPYESPYVVKIESAVFIGEPKQVFSFYHPKQNKDKTHIKLTFNHETIFPIYIHGFAGYFNSVLYPDINMGIVPAMHTKDLHSWFPMFFPINEPLLVEPGDSIEVALWRDSNTSSVWYEWAIAVKSTIGSLRSTAIHNMNGRGYSIGLY